MDRYFADDAKSIPKAVAARLAGLSLEEREKDPQLLRMEPVTQAAILRQAYNLNPELRGPFWDAFDLARSGVPYRVTWDETGLPRVVPLAGEITTSPYRPGTPITPERAKMRGEVAKHRSIYDISEEMDVSPPSEAELRKKGMAGFQEDYDFEVGPIPLNSDAPPRYFIREKRSGRSKELKVSPVQALTDLSLGKGTYDEIMSMPGGRAEAARLILGAIDPDNLQMTLLTGGLVRAFPQLALPLLLGSSVYTGAAAGEKLAEGDPGAASVLLGSGVLPLAPQVARDVEAWHRSRGANVPKGKAGYMPPTSPGPRRAREAARAEADRPLRPREGRGAGDTEAMHAGTPDAAATGGAGISGRLADLARSWRQSKADHVALKRAADQLHIDLLSRDYPAWQGRQDGPAELLGSDRLVLGVRNGVVYLSDRAREEFARMFGWTAGRAGAYMQRHVLPKRVAKLRQEMAQPDLTPSERAALQDVFDAMKTAQEQVKARAQAEYDQGLRQNRSGAARPANPAFAFGGRDRTR
jgi:hypothetical protein